jgi:2-amino-4-hydroxy-6-hydroxymethyldihydropteridine diphosphokinase
VSGEVLATPIVLPTWAQVSDKRRSHIARVVALLEHWASAMGLPQDELSRWIAAGTLHDALRDAPETMLRALTGDRTSPAELLHGPAAAVRAEQDGERRRDVLDAIRFHTIGNADWTRTGRALYLADFLEPGRAFLQSERARIAEKVPRDFDGAFRDVVRTRIELALREGGKLFPESVALWNAVR